MILPDLRSAERALHTAKLLAQGLTHAGLSSIPCVILTNLGILFELLSCMEYCWHERCLLQVTKERAQWLK